MYPGLTHRVIIQSTHCRLSTLQNLGLGVFEEKKPSGSSDDESDVDESDIIINPFAKEMPETKPGITLLDHDESGEEDSDSSSDEEES